MSSKIELQIPGQKKTYKLHPIILAPLAGITSLPFRTLSRAVGAKFAFLEMISARSLSYESKRTMEMMLTNKLDQPLGVQLLGKDPYYILKAIEKLKKYPYQVLDFNAACPQKKITGNDKGAALLKDPKKLSSLLRIIVKESKKPVTVKMRLGWRSPKEGLKIAQYAQDSGISAIFVHGRTKIQGYRSPVEYKELAKIKNKLSIPMIASGDIWDCRLAKKMLDKTGADGITIARGCLGNPWIFKEIDSFLRNGKILSKPSPRKVSITMKKHLKLYLDFYGERIGCIHFRKFFIWYTKGFSNTKPLRNKVHFAVNKITTLKLIEEFLNL